MFVKLLVALVSLALLYNIVKRGVRIPFLRRPQPETPEPVVPAATEEGAAPAAPATPAPMAVATGDKEKDWRDHPASELVTLLMVTLTFMSFTAYFVGLPGFLDFSVINEFLAKFTSADLGLIHELYFDTDNHYRHELWLITWSVILFVWLKFKTRKTDWNRAAGILKFLVLMVLAYVLINTVTNFSARNTVKSWFKPNNTVILSATSPTRLPGNWAVIPGSRKILTGKGTNSNDYALKVIHDNYVKHGQKLVIITSTNNDTFYVDTGNGWKEQHGKFEYVFNQNVIKKGWIYALASPGKNLIAELRTLQ